jgi:hypothetical protein
VVEHIAPIMMGWYCHNLVTSPHDGDFITAATSAPPLPDDLPGRIGYLREASDRFAGVVASVDLDAPVWTFGPAGPARFWLLRAATETAIHRWDAEAAIGKPTAITAARAAASIDETVRGMWRALVATEWPASSPVRTPQVPDRPLWVHAIDAGRTWTVRADNGSLDVVADNDDASATERPDTRIEGRGHDLMLYLWGRQGTEGIRTRGPVDAWNLCVRSNV